MTKKLNYHYFKTFSLSRNHVLLEVTDMICIRNGRLKLFCNTCKNNFETSARSYLSARKTGCTYCKKMHISIITKQRFAAKKLITPNSPDYLLTIERKLHNLLNKQKKYACLNCLHDLIEYLRTNENVYNNFIMQKILHSSTPEVDLLLEKHHIIPLHAGGPNKSWNLINLTPTEHLLAHQLRLLVFQEAGDRLACQFRSMKNLSQEKQKQLPLKSGHKTALERKVGFYDSRQQSINGIKGGTIQTDKKILNYRKKMGSKVLEHLASEVIWQHAKTGSIVKIEANSLQLLTQMIPLLVESLSKLKLSSCKDLNKLQTGSKSSITSFIARVIREERSSCYGWSIKSKTQQ